MERREIERKKERNREKKREKREKKREKERNREKKEIREKGIEKDIQSQLSPIYIQFSKRKNILTEMLEISKSGCCLRIYNIIIYDRPPSL